MQRFCASFAACKRHDGACLEACLHGVMGRAGCDSCACVSNSGTDRRNSTLFVYCGLSCPVDSPPNHMPQWPQAAIVRVVTKRCCATGGYLAQDACGGVCAVQRRAQTQGHRTEDRKEERKRRVRSAPRGSSARRPLRAEAGRPAAACIRRCALGAVTAAPGAGRGRGGVGS